jgi:hypothetical protein
MVTLSTGVPVFTGLLRTSGSLLDASSSAEEAGWQVSIHTWEHSGSFSDYDRNEVWAQSVQTEGDCRGGFHTSSWFVGNLRDHRGDSTSWL